MLGKIVSSSYGTYVVYSNGVNYTVFPRGLFRFKNEHLVVGDEVEFADTNFVVTKIFDRKNELIRPKVSNLDHVFVTISVKEPELSLELLYKFLTYVNMNNINPSVIFTKIDLLPDLTVVNNVKNDLDKLGIKVYLVSKKDPSSLNELKEILKNKTSIFLGQTGVGKSSIINLIDPSFSRKVGEYSISRGRGKHQTKEVLLLPYENGFIGDTPGFSALDLNVFKEDLAHFFPGYNDYVHCYFSNCLHQNEKQCAIKKSIENNLLSKDAYNIYLKLLEELPYKKERYK